MELIKITPMIDIDEILLNSHESKVYKNICESNYSSIELINEGSIVETLIKGLIDLVSTRYRLTAHKLLTQSKQINDLYTKVDDMLRNDRIARLKHSRDKINYELHFIVIKDSRNPKHDYRLEIDDLVYNPEYAMESIDKIMKYINNFSKDKQKNFKELKAQLMDVIDSDFNTRHAFIKYCSPLLKIVKYGKKRLESVLMGIKNQISELYLLINKYNQYVSAQLQYLQILQVAYNKCLSQFRSDKLGKELTDEVFKKLIKNASMSIDFNSKCMTILTDMINWDADELSKIYDIIRS